jgi:membrane protein implicated in regulation of membrane protease activity
VIAIGGGIALIIAGVVAWLGNISLEHALAIFMVIVGVLVILYGVAPTYWSYRRRSNT